MTAQADYTAEEWALLAKSPLMVSLAVVNASRSNPVGVLQEMFAMSKVLVESKQQHSGNQLVSALVDFVTSDAGKKASQQSLQGLDLNQARALALSTCQQVVALVGSKTSAEEAQGYRQWLYTVAAKVAEAAKEGGFLGIGGQAVSGEEKAVLSDLAGALGVSA